MSEQNETTFVEDEAFKERLNTCASCEKFDGMSGVCVIDGSVMLVKAKLPSSSCPDAKWLAEGT